MNEDLPLHRHAVLACWLLFITGTIALFIIPGIFHSHNNFQLLYNHSTYRVAISQRPAEQLDYLFQTIIQEASDRYQVDPALIRAIIMAESSYNPKAISRKGACGLMQLMPATAKSLGVEDSFNPEHNIYGGVKYFKQLLDRFDGDTRIALAAYNAGSRNVRQYEGVPPFKATHYYIKRVFSYYDRYKAEMNSV